MKREIMSKEKLLYNYIKFTFIDKQIKKDLEEKTKYTKQIIKKCKEEYGFDDEVVIRIFNRLYYNTERTSRLNKYNKEYMLGMSTVWYRNNIKKKEDIEKYYKNLEEEIINIIKRRLTTYEKICIENMIYINKVDENTIIDTIKENGKLDINELRMLENLK